MKDWFEWGLVGDGPLRKATVISDEIPNTLNLGFCWSPGTARALVTVVSVRLRVCGCTDQKRLNSRVIPKDVAVCIASCWSPEVLQGSWWLLVAQMVGTIKLVGCKATKAQGK